MRQEEDRGPRGESISLWIRILLPLILQTIFVAYTWGGRIATLENDVKWIKTLQTEEHAKIWIKIDRLTERGESK